MVTDNVVVRPMKPTSPGNFGNFGASGGDGSLEPELESAAVELTGIVKRRWKIIAAVLFGVLTAAATYAFTSPAIFTATTFLLIDARHADMLGDRQQSERPQPVASPEVDSQVEVLKSERIALAVIRKLDLVNNDVFNRKGWLSFEKKTTPLPPASVRERQVLRGFVDSLSIERVNLTYVVQVKFEATDPVLAATVANTIANTYLADQIEARFDALQQARVWLDKRIQALRKKQMVSEQSVASFRAQHNMVSAGEQTVGDQQLTDLNARLTLARTQTADALAKWQQIQRVVAAGDIQAPALTDVIGNPSMNRLRDQFADLVRRKGDVVNRVGRDHAAVAQLDNEIKQVRELILAELRSVEGSIRNEYEIAKARMEALIKEFEAAKRANVRTDEASIQLRDLQREADTNRSLLENFLGRHAIASEQQKFPTSEARVITAATPPLRPSSPKKKLILAVGSVLGLVLGFAAALLVDRLEPGFRTRRQVRAELGVPLSGIVPVISQGHRGERSTRLGTLKEHVPQDLPANRQVQKQNPVMRLAINSVLSRFTDAMRSIRLVAERAASKPGGRIIGFVSTVPNEGKSTLSANFAQLLADSGERVILIDADFRRAALSGELAPANIPGAVEVVMGFLPLSEALLFDVETGLEFLGNGDRCSASESAALANSKPFKQFVSQLSAAYDWIILDLPPLVPVVDANAVAEIVDAFILVIEWGGTPRHVVTHALDANHAVKRKLAGCVFNKVDMKRMGVYEPQMNLRYSSSYYTSSH